MDKHMQFLTVQPKTKQLLDTVQYSFINELFINLMNRRKSEYSAIFKTAIGISRTFSAAMSQDKLSILRNYKINPNKFKITTNLIYLLLNSVLFVLFHSFPTDSGKMV